METPEFGLEGGRLFERDAGGLEAACDELWNRELKKLDTRLFGCESRRGDGWSARLEMDDVSKLLLLTAS